MDPALLKQRQEFMRQAIRSMDTMQQIKKDSTEGTSSSTVQQKSKKKRVAPIKESKSTLSST